MTEGCMSVVIEQPAADRRADGEWRGEENHNAPEHAASNRFVCLWEDGLAHGAALREGWLYRQSSQGKGEDDETDNCNDPHHALIVLGGQGSVNFPL